MRTIVTLSAVAALAGCGPGGAAPTGPETPRRPVLMAEEMRPAIRTLLTDEWKQSSGLPPRISEADVRKFLEKCTFQKIDLDRDGTMEVLVDYWAQSGQHGNRMFYVFAAVDGKRKCIAELLGNTYTLQYSEQGAGYPEIETLWYNGGGSSTVTTYWFEDGSYGVVRSRIIRPEPCE